MLPMSNSFMMLTMTTLFMSTMMMISSTNWLLLWCGLEINLLSFIPIMSMSNKFSENEAMTKYFLIQALGSSFILMASTSLWSSNFPISPTYLLIMALMLKMGMAPCHFWFPSVMSAISWINCMILSTWQKLGPLLIMSFLMKSSTLPYLMMFISSINALTGGLLGLNQSKIKSIMAYSSITHMGWMTSPIILNMQYLTMYYFTFYCILTIPMFLLMYWLSTDSQSQLQKAMSSFKLSYILIPLIIMSLSGLPPLTGFFPKLMIIMLLSNMYPSILLLMILGAMMNMYFYLNLSFSMIMQYNNINSTSSVSLSPTFIMVMTLTSTFLFIPMTLITL